MASGSGTEVDVCDIIDAIPTDARDGLIQVVKVGAPWRFAIQYAPGSWDEMVSTKNAMTKKFPSMIADTYKSLVVLRDKE